MKKLFCIMLALAFLALAACVGIGGNAKAA